MTFPCIPPATYAIAAYEAARIFREDPADIFDPSCKSRARYIAILAMRNVFPSVPRSILGRHLGIEGTAKSINRNIESARNSLWLRDSEIEYVRRCICEFLKQPLSFEEEGNAVVAIRAVEPDKRAAVFIPRRVTPRVVNVRVPVRMQNVTAYLMGDPSSRSARVDRGETSRGL